MESSAVQDPEFLMLVGCCHIVEHEFSARLQQEAWNNSPFAWIRQHSIGAIGAIGARLVSAWCAVHNVSVSSAPNTKSDRIVGKTPTEIKFATLGKNGKYTFNQIRTAGYDKLILFGVSPQAAHAWVVPRDTAVEHSKRQHGDETFVLQFNPTQSPDWVTAYGGSLADAAVLLKRL